MKTKNDKVKDVKIKAENQDHENIIKSFKIDNKNYKKEYKNLNKKKVILFITETLEGSA